MEHIDQHRRHFTPAQLAALLYADRVTTSAEDVDTRLWMELQDHFSDDAIVEMTALIGFVNAMNRFAGALGLS